MVKLIDLLKEIGEASARPYDWKRTVDEEDYKEYMFQTKAGLYYKVEIQVLEGDEERDSAYVQFGIVEPDEDNMGFTDFDAVPTRGDLFNIMATIVDVLKDLIKNNPNIKYLQFETDKRSHITNKGKKVVSNARFDLYTKYIQKHLPNAEVTTDSKGGYEMTSIKLKEIGDSSARAYKWEKTYNDEYERIYSFDTDSDQVYNVIIDEIEPEDLSTDKIGTMIGVRFYVVGEDPDEEDYEKVVNKKELFKVMATIVDILKFELKLKPYIKAIVFKPSKRKVQDRARLELYKKYLKNFYPNVEYETDGEEVIAILNKDRAIKELNVPKPEDAYKFISTSKAPHSSGFYYTYTFKNNKGQELDVTNNVVDTEDQGKLIYVAFGIAGIEPDSHQDDIRKYGVKTDSGNMLKVMATVVEAIKRTMKQEGGEDKVSMILFSPSDEKRDRIYNYYIQTLFSRFRKAVNKFGMFTAYVNQDFKK